MLELEVRCAIVGCDICAFDSFADQQLWGPKLISYLLKGQAKVCKRVVRYRKPIVREQKVWFKHVRIVSIGHFLPEDSVGAVSLKCGESLSFKELEIDGIGYILLLRLEVINQAEHRVQDIHLASFPKLPVHLEIIVLW